MSRLHVDDTGVLETSLNVVNPYGFSVYLSEPYCERTYSPAPTAAAVTTVSPNQRRDLVFGFGFASAAVEFEFESDFGVWSALFLGELVDAKLRDRSFVAVRLDVGHRVSERTVEDAFKRTERGTIGGSEALERTVMSFVSACCILDREIAKSRP